MSTFQPLSNCIVDVSDFQRFSLTGHEPFPLVDKINTDQTIEDTPYYHCYRRFVIGSSRNDRFFFIQDKIKYKFSKTQMKTMVRERNLIALKTNGSPDLTWFSVANCWQIARNLNEDYAMRQTLSPVIYMVFRRYHMPFELIDIIIKIVVESERQNITRY